MSPVSDLTSGQPTVERLPPKAPGGRPAPPDIEPLITEVAALAGLLAQVVEMARKAAIFPGHWETIAEHAMEHQGVRAALAAEDALITRSDSMAAARPASPGGAVTVPAPPHTYFKWPE